MNRLIEVETALKQRLLAWLDKNQATSIPKWFVTHQGDIDVEMDLQFVTTVPDHKIGDALDEIFHQIENERRR